MELNNRIPDYNDDYQGNDDYEYENTYHDLEYDEDSSSVNSGCPECGSEIRSSTYTDYCVNCDWGYGY